MKESEKGGGRTARLHSQLAAGSAHFMLFSTLHLFVFLPTARYMWVPSERRLQHTDHSGGGHGYVPFDSGSDSKFISKRPTLCRAIRVCLSASRYSRRPGTPLSLLVIVEFVHCRLRSNDCFDQHAVTYHGTAWIPLLTYIDIVHDLTSRASH